MGPSSGIEDNTGNRQNVYITNFQFASDFVEPVLTIIAPMRTSSASFTMVLRCCISRQRGKMPQRLAVLHGVPNP
jgi:hypothetical protein